MDNPGIFNFLEQHRNSLFEKLKATSISGHYKEQHEDIKTGKALILNIEEKRILSDLNKLSKDTSRDDSFKRKINDYLSLDNDALTVYFQKEFERVFKAIINSGKHDEIQALFIEYDAYAHPIGNITCYGKQQYPVIDEPRYITDEYDYTKQIIFIDDGINFQPAWLDCSEFGSLDYLDIDFELENLFQLHSRTLLHKALDGLKINGKLDFIKNRPFYFYINEHDNEVMMLYVLN
jgi:hypothetical protein